MIFNLHYIRAGNGAMMERNIFKFSMNRYQRDPTPSREKIKESLGSQLSTILSPLILTWQKKKSPRSGRKNRAEGFSSTFHSNNLCVHSTRFIDQSPRGNLEELWKNLNLMKCIHFNFPIFPKLSPPPSSIKSDRLFEKPVISRYKGPGQKGFSRLFSIYSLFVPRRRGKHLPFLPRQASQNFIFPERGGGGGGKLSFDRNDVTKTTPPPSFDSYFIPSEF